MIYNVRNSYLLDHLFRCCMLFDGTARSAAAGTVPAKGGPMLEQVNRLRRDVDSTRSAIESLLDEYGLFIDHDMAGVISSYVRSLQLDFELALSRGRAEELTRILEDMLELHNDTRKRLLGESIQNGVQTPIES